MNPETIKTARARLGLSQRKLADRLGVGLSTVRHWEQGLRSITKRTEAQINNLLERDMSTEIILTNAFSLNMMQGRFTGYVHFESLPLSTVAALLTMNEWKSAVGHADTAELFSNILGMEVEANRINVRMSKDVTLIVGQYIGPRLEPGVTELPENARIAWWRITQ